MASPAPGKQSPSVQIGQKRKRDENDNDIKHEVKHEVKNQTKDEHGSEDVEDDGGAKIDTKTLVPENYEPEEDNEDGADENDEEDENAAEENANHPKHDESDEPFPSCAYYDDATKDIEERLTSIAERVYELLEDRESDSKALLSHRQKAKELSKIPVTEKIRVAILGGAGAGKSSLLNAVTGKPDLAKSVSDLPMLFP